MLEIKNWHLTWVGPKFYITFTLDFSEGVKHKQQWWIIKKLIWWYNDAEKQHRQCFTKNWIWLFPNSYECNKVDFIIGERYKNGRSFVLVTYIGVDTCGHYIYLVNNKH